VLESSREGQLRARDLGLELVVHSAPRDLPQALGQVSEAVKVIDGLSVLIRPYLDLQEPGLSGYGQRSKVS
jgi:hypothetical protein